MARYPSGKPAPIRSDGYTKRSDGGSGNAFLLDGQNQMRNDPRKGMIRGALARRFFLERLIMKPSIIVWGPQGCGKTRNAKKIAAHFGLPDILDGFSFGEHFPKFDTLILTNCVPDQVEGGRRPLFVKYETLPKSVRS